MGCKGVRLRIMAIRRLVGDGRGLLAHGHRRAAKSKYNAAHGQVRAMLRDLGPCAGHRDLVRAALSAARAFECFEQKVEG